MKIEKPSVFAAMASAVTFLPIIVSAQTFTPIGHLANTNLDSRAYGISANGSIVVGESLVGPTGPSGNFVRAIHWTSGGLAGLPFPVNGTRSVVYAVSADGSTFGGGVVTDGSNNDIDMRPLIWTSTSSTPTLLGNTTSKGRVRALSSDGLVVVGRLYFSFVPKAFRWTAGGGFQQLPDIAGADQFSAAEARGVSPDGTIVIGQAESTNFFPEAFRWTAGTGTVGLGRLTGGTYSEAFAISADGTTIVGRGNRNVGSGFQQHGFRWTQGSGIQSIGLLPDGFSSEVEAVSADGSKIVGRSFVSGASHAVLWTDANGLVKISDLASNAIPSGWILQAATAISADGSKIAGWGRNPQNQPEGWIISLATTPSAPTLSMFVDGGELVLSWPASLPGVILESVGNLSNTWGTEEGVTPETVGDQTQARIPIGIATRFFRLRQP